MKFFVDVILPLPIPGVFTYSLDEADSNNIQVGCRVIVPFGKKKYYTAIVFSIHHVMPQEYEVKPVFTILDKYPILLPSQLQFWEWISDYYISALGDVFKAALPSGLKLESETMVELNMDYIGSPDLSEKELRVLHLLSVDPIQCITKIAKDSGIDNILPIANSLLERGAILLREELKEQYRPRMESRIRFTKEYNHPDKVENLFELLSNAPKQLDIVIKYVELSSLLNQKEIGRAHV